MYSKLQWYKYEGRQAGFLSGPLPAFIAVCPDSGIEVNSYQAKVSAVFIIKHPTAEQEEFVKDLVERNNNRNTLKDWANINYNIAKKKYTKLNKLRKNGAEGAKYKAQMEIYEELFHLMNPASEPVGE